MYNTTKSTTKAAILLNIIFLLTIIPARAGTNSFKLSAGGKVYYTEDSSESNSYYHPFISAGYSGSLAELEGTCSLLLAYPLLSTDDILYESNINRYGISFAFFPVKYFSLNLQGDYYSGDFNYRRSDGSIEFYFEFFDFSTSLGGKKGSSRYEIDNNRVELNTTNIFAELIYNLSKSFSIDLSYTRSSLKSDEFVYENTTKIWRTGILAVFRDKLYLLTGGSYGKDSEDYTIYGADLGISLYLFKHVKFNFLYIYTYNNSNIDLTGTDNSYSLHNLSSGMTFYL